MAEGKLTASDLVGDAFWLEFAKDAVKGAVKGPEQRAVQLTATIAWFWSVYSSAGILAIAFGAERIGTVASVLVAVPSLVLVLAYWKASAVGRPYLTGIDPRVPAEISAAFVAAAAEKKSALWWAEFWTTVAAAFVAIGTISAAWMLSSDADPNLSGRFAPSDARQLMVAAVVPRHSMATFTAVPAAPASGASATGISSYVRAGDDGSVGTTLHTTAPGQQRVSVSWLDEKSKSERSISIDVKP